MNLEHAAHGHERRLAEALGALVRQVDVSGYRDAGGRTARDNAAFRHAQALVDEFGVTHADICEVLGTCGDDPDEAARRLAERTARGSGAAPKASPGDQPPEYRTWRTGP